MVLDGWDEVMAGPHPTTRTRSGLSINTGGEGGERSSKYYQRSLSMPGSPATPGTPVTPTTPSPTAATKKENVWRSVFHPGSNIATKRIGAEMFDKPSHPNSPTVYDWLYSGETRSKHQ
ncbi:dormancy-associated protein 1-like isoform X2 [Nicotiana tabacum]|uniref:Dormancy-associated protein 1-like isoform X2 n=1 Tax=Nicotiana tabacum TaxID=4097 RepID=A0AC58SLT3_TOBAC|nr:dormancy-associated protein homolog 1-like isoform X2 [Nicotiana tomentosiformis]